MPTLKAIGDAAAASGKGAEGLNQVAGAFLGTCRYLGRSLWTRLTAWLQRVSRR
ncbi:hypothetical protein P7H22_20635 [Paenibacillus larvae]|nr:hypothetical protein [Paenibacillus larvae]MDT2242274.1 hypothetical protein [Paenibacillus larvae]